MGFRKGRSLIKFITCFVFLTMVTIMWQCNSVFKLKGRFINLVEVQKNTPNSNCEVIHIGIVCSGYTSHLYLYTMLKSIFFHRNNPLYFHFVVDEITKKILTKLFETWNVPQVTVKFYSIDDIASRVQWVPSHHYSGIYGLLKLTFSTVIPASITNKIIILDTDLVFTGDIYELWNFFYNFNETQIIGFVENQSGYYLGTLGYKPPWPAIGKGFNSGVILYDLKRMRSIEWEELWVEVARKTAKTHGKAMGDQDILNAIIKNNSDLLYQLPCYWNTQMSDHTDSYECYKNNQIKVIHWNSPNKTKVMHKDGDNFRPVNRMFTEMNGNLVLRELNKCFASSKEKERHTKDECLQLQQAPVGNWRTFLYFSPFNYKPVKNDVTLISHLPFNKLKALEDLAKIWSGPMSLTFYVTDLELYESFNYINSSKVLGMRSNIAYHAVFMERDYYPINTLRNVAMRNIITPYLFEVDVDYLPVQELYTKLKTHIGVRKNMKKKAFIVPTLQMKDPKFQIPVNKKEALKMLSKKELSVLESDKGILGFESTNYDKWKTAKKPYTVKWKPLFQPFIVVKNVVTKYDERVFDYGRSKLLHTMELEAQHYEFIVLEDVFIVNRKLPSIFNEQLTKKPEYVKCWQQFKTQYIQKLNSKYGSKFNTA